MNHLRLLQHVRGAMLVLDDHHADGRVSKGVRAEWTKPTGSASR